MEDKKISVEMTEDEYNLYLIIKECLDNIGIKTVDDMKKTLESFKELVATFREASDALAEDIGPKEEREKSEDLPDFLQ